MRLATGREVDKERDRTRPEAINVVAARHEERHDLGTARKGE